MWGYHASWHRSFVDYGKAFERCIVAICFGYWMTDKKPGDRGLISSVCQYWPPQTFNRGGWGSLNVSHVCASGITIVYRYCISVRHVGTRFPSSLHFHAQRCHWLKCHTGAITTLSRSMPGTLTSLGSKIKQRTDQRAYEIQFKANPGKKGPAIISFIGKGIHGEVENVLDEASLGVL